MNHVDGLVGASVDAIEHHYDIGNRFYAAFLDERMVYSAALWREGDTLETAQLRKLDHHLNESRAHRAARILDIGCGWGALLRRAVEGYDVEHAVGLTLSRAQHHEATQRSTPNIDVRWESWRDHRPESPYDAIISIGAFEHFVKPDLSRSDRESLYREFFTACWRWLNPGRRLSLQTISYDNMPRHAMSRFIADEIFPESDLPKAAEIFDASDGLFSCVAMRNDGAHYEETCREWLRRFKRNEALIVELTSAERFAQFCDYLRLCAMGFRVRTMGLLRLTFERLDDAYRAPPR